MKKILLLTLTVILFGFTNCSSSDDDNGNGGGTTTFDNWNDPKSPNYKPEGYNPIKGDWIRKHYTGAIYRYTDDFKYMQGWSDTGQFSLISGYSINDKQFRSYNSKESKEYTTKNYSINGDTLTITYLNESATYTKLK